MILKIGSKKILWLIAASLLIILLIAGIISKKNKELAGINCPIVLINSQEAAWTPEGKRKVTEVCQIILLDSGYANLFNSKLLRLKMFKGNGGGNASQEEINFYISEIQDTKEATITFLHEITHSIDAKLELVSRSTDWLIASGWVCSNIGNCQHPCQQTDSKYYYCDSAEQETLPSRYGYPEYNRRETDVSVNPTEDFAETSKYFLAANDELTVTSPKRCAFMMNFYKKLSTDSCFDCNSKTVCTNPNALKIKLQ